MSNRKTIYLDDAIDLVKYRMKHNPMKSVEFIQGLQDGYLRVLSDLERLPSAERKGKWIEMGTNKDGTHNIKCSKCGEGYKTRGHARSIATKTKYKFCPNCGSDNRGEEDD